VGDLKDMEYFEERFRILCDYQMQANPGLKIDVEKEVRVTTPAEIPS
jgi:hypothetical protein